MNFKRERAHNVIDEMMPLFNKHYQEIAHYKDIPLEPDFNLYRGMEEANVLRVFTARDDLGILVGYCIFFIKHNPHYKSCLTALQDILFIEPASRGFGAKFILWCDKQLKDEGVQIVCQHIKAAHDFGHMLERLGYEFMDKIYVKRLDREK